MPVRHCAGHFTVALVAGAFTACAVAPAPTAAPAVPAQRWHAPLPHAGQTEQLVQWWRSFNDPLLAALILEAQASSPTLAEALARLRQARANLAVAEGGRAPSATLNASAGRASNATTSLVPLTQASASVDASWEIDLFGGVRHAVDAAQARAESAGYGWHDARLSLAAEVAEAYLGLRSCEALGQVYDDDASSQARSAGLTQDKVRVGFESPANGALAQAAAAQARDRAAAQRAQCDLSVKALVGLTGSEESSLRERLAPQQGRLPQPLGFAPPALPAQLLAQRPDLAAAASDMAAAAYDVGVAEAQRYPSISFNGSLGGGLLRLNGNTNEAVTWSFGPSVSLPLFDAGRRRAQAQAAQARYDERRAALSQRLRLAVREVEEALVRLDAAGRRQADAALAAQGYRRYFEATQERWRLGAGSVIELEEARRNSLAAQATHTNVQREQVSAWVSLYRALGGGWDAATPLP